MDAACKCPAPHPTLNLTLPPLHLRLQYLEVLAEGLEGPPLPEVAQQRWDALLMVMQHKRNASGLQVRRRRRGLRLRCSYGSLGAGRPGTSRGGPLAFRTLRCAASQCWPEL